MRKFIISKEQEMTLKNVCRYPECTILNEGVFFLKYLKHLL